MEEVPNLPKIDRLIANYSFQGHKISNRTLVLQRGRMVLTKKPAVVERNRNVLDRKGRKISVKSKEIKYFNV